MRHGGMNMNRVKSKAKQSKKSKKNHHSYDYTNQQKTTKYNHTKKESKDNMLLYDVEREKERGKERKEGRKKGEGFNHQRSRARLALWTTYTNIIGRYWLIVY